MISLKFCRGPHIDDLPLLKRHRWLQVGTVNPLSSFGRQSGSLCFLGGDPAEDVTEVDAIKLPHGEIGIFRLLQHQQNRIAPQTIPRRADFVSGGRDIDRYRNSPDLRTLKAPGS